MNKEHPKISVVTITWGHEKFIADTLNGVFMQRYDGEIELIIADDNSPDNTGQVIVEFIDTHTVPSNIEIKYTKHTKNKGVSQNFVWAIKQATGKYIAICEGDDYWTDPLKLQKQVDFLEKNEEYVLCFTNRDVLENNIVKISSPLHSESSFGRAEIPYRYVPTLTVLFRNVVQEMPARMRKTMIDCSLFLFLSQYGSFFYIDESMAMYRVHNNGVYSGNSKAVNYGRSTKARIVAWFSLKNVDKVSLAHAIKYWINLKKQTEIDEKKYFSVCTSYLINWFFNLYILQTAMRKKLNNILHNTR